MPDSLLLFKPSGAGGGVGASEVLRTPDTFKTGQANGAGNTVIWTPTAGKRFRLLGYVLDLSNDAILAVAGLVTASLTDNAVAIGIAHDFWLPTLALATAIGRSSTGVIMLPGNGYLSGAINQTLGVSLSGALGATGKFRLNAFGCEENS